MAHGKGQGPRVHGLGVPTTATGVLFTLWAPAACGLENKNKRDAWWHEDLVESCGRSPVQLLAKSGYSTCSNFLILKR